MSEVAQMYNSLPTLGHADDTFVDRSNIFPVVAKLLAEYDNKFGLCLVHSHCKLNDGEIMLERDNISQPEKLDNAGAYYPCRWLSSGTPYEFATVRVQTPTQELFDQFHALAKDLNLGQIIGLYPIEGAISDPANIEWTDGRQNLSRHMLEVEKMDDFIQTAWDFARGDPVTMGCTKWCDTRTTRSEKPNVHKGTSSHRKTEP